MFQNYYDYLYYAFTSFYFINIIYINKVSRMDDNKIYNTLIFVLLGEKKGLSRI